VIIKNQEDCEKLIKFIEANKQLAFDTETTGINHHTDKVIGFGLANDSEGHYVVHLAWDGSELQEVIPLETCKYLLSLLNKHELITHNGSFDMRMTLNYFGVDLISNIFSDSQLAYHTINETGVPFSHAPFSLKTIGAHFYGDSATDEQVKMKASIKANGGTAHEFFKADSQVLGTYCVQDCLLTYRLNHKFMNQIVDEGLWNFYQYDEVMPLYRTVTIPMEQRGIPLDVPLLEKAQLEITEDLAKLESTILQEIEPQLDLFNEWYLNKEHPVRTTGPFVQQLAKMLKVNLPLTPAGQFSMAAPHIAKLPPNNMLRKFLEGKYKLDPQMVKQIQLSLQGGLQMFNLSSKDHLKRLFFTKLNEEPKNRTDKGAPQVDEEFLDTMVSKHPWVSKLIEFNKLTKLKGTYIDRFLEKQLNGRYYPQFFQHRTVSGRYGSDLQQLPRPIKDNGNIVSKYNNLVRRFFSQVDGRVFVDADYESLEPKIFSHVCGDEKLQQIFLNGDDFYSTIAIMTEGIPNVSANKKAPNYLGLVNPAARQTAKAYSLGVPYGLTGYKMQFELGCSQEEGDRLVANYLAAFPALAQWMENSELAAVEQGQVSSLAGRIRHMPRAAKLVEQYGMELLDSLLLWKKYHENPPLYEQMKKHRRELKNYLNNAKNFQIQSFAASIVNQASVQINKQLIDAGLDAHICCNIHDQLILDSSEKDAGQSAQIMQQCMEHIKKLTIPLVAVPKIGKNFYETH
jgi:DNA polymerase I-like protein with 3'-5' exonuclease and polymerase domains